MATLVPVHLGGAGGALVVPLNGVTGHSCLLEIKKSLLTALVALIVSILGSHDALGAQPCDAGILCYRAGSRQCSQRPTGASVMHPLGCIPWEASAVLERHRYDTFKHFSSFQTVYVVFTGKCNP